MRLFAAIDLPDDVRSRVTSLVDSLRGLARIQWSHPENLHITTKFIGEWPDSRLDELKAGLSAAHSSFQVTLRGLGWFPDDRRPRVFYMGVDGGSAIHELARLTDTATAALGVPLETKPYSPHVTLARIREKTRLDDLRRAIALRESVEFGHFGCDRFWLYESRPTREGTMYIKLADFSLGRS